MKRPIIAITTGDPAGIGAEITVKALHSPKLYDIAKPVVIGSKAVFEEALKITSSSLQLHLIDTPEQLCGQPGTIDLLDLSNIQLNQFTYGEVGIESGRASVEYILEGIELARQGKVGAVVTGPISKEAINLAGFKFAGHTEIFAQKTQTKDYAMMLTHGNMRVIHVSTHVSLREACDRVKKDRVLRVIHLAHNTVKKLDIETPRIAVAGLNPHSGEHGMFGTEEIEEIIPAIDHARAEHIFVDGPIPPDTLFPKLKGGQYDIAVVMYHDQGHIPMKLAGFNYNDITKTWSSVSGVNVTVGLPIIRTSVDHGVAYDQAGKGTASADSMLDAIHMAVQLAT